MSNEFGNFDCGFEKELRELEVHKITILVVDHDGLGAEGVKYEIDNVAWHNHCMNPEVKQVQTQTIQYTDAHPINSTVECDAEYNRLFPNESAISPESAAIILNADGSYELAMPKIGDEDIVQPHVLLTTALFHFFSQLKPVERERIVTSFVGKTGLGAGGG